MKENNQGMRVYLNMYKNYNNFFLVSGLQFKDLESKLR
jgi:hypothetical protein